VLSLSTREIRAYHDYRVSQGQADEPDGVGINLDYSKRQSKSPLVIMERDPDAPRGGYSAWSYCQALEEGLQTNYKPGGIFVHDNAPIHESKEAQEWLESRGI